MRIALAALPLSLRDLPARADPAERLYLPPLLRALPAEWLRRPGFDRLISHELALGEIVAGFELASSAQCGKVLV